ncbi:hypothetical protein PEDI_49300 [Persicobacter diffluens]|uniref:Glucosylceramidase n=2 Tax=Persicobacter diffluens TaxID=981 RepID=A0AAN5AQ04_9BACT|nr:hypothetical protein PEDI_49300 [Persicobacter diffluens]
MLGGIGAGGVEIRKDGQFYNWSILNNYPNGSAPILHFPTRPNSPEENSYLFFMVRYQVEGQQPQIKLLQLNNDIAYGGLLNEAPIYYFPWMSSVDQIEYSARFPFADLTFSDEDMPFEVKLESYAPFIPHDVKNSSLPAIDFNFELKSKIDKPLSVSIIATQRNLVAYDTPNKYFTVDIVKKDGVKYFKQSVGNVSEEHDSFGQMGLGAIGGDEVSYYLGWSHRHPFLERLLTQNDLGNIDDSKNRNKLNKAGEKIAWTGGGDNNQVFKSSIAVSKTLKAKEQMGAHFFMNWYFPNAIGWVSSKKERGNDGLIKDPKGYQLPIKKTSRVGHYYENSFENYDQVVDYFVANNKSLKERSKAFVDDMYRSDVEQYILDQINSQLNTFVTSSQLDKEGRFAIREGLTNNQSWGPFATSDVSLYGSASIIALFPELQKNMMRCHAHAQTPDGEINHGLGADLGLNQNGTFGVYERVDLAPNFIQLVLRDYLFTNDKAYIKEMWPSVKKAIDYVLREKDLDGDQMPDMEGIMCSYDNFPMYGLASYITTQWISAMSMAAIVAEDMGESKNAKKYKKIADKGIKLMDKYLWNGNYYRLANDYHGDKGKDEGCLTDQLFGQWVAYEAGVGRLFEKEKVHSAMRSILSYSYIENDYLRNCTWPEHPKFFPMAETNLWVDQANTPWTGVELAFASFLIREGMVEEGKQIVKSIDDRYRKAGLYWDHQEFGGHYYRPMSAWSVLNALAGYNLVKDHYTFAPKNHEESYNLFFSANTGTGALIKDHQAVNVEAYSGTLQLASLTLPTTLWQKKNNLITTKEGAVKVKKWIEKDGMTTAIFDQVIELEKGENLMINPNAVTLN